MKVIIIDDEKGAISSLKLELETSGFDVDIIGVAETVNSGIQLLNSLVPDVLFLDIRLKDGLGFDILEKIDPSKSFRIVFTTAYDNYAIKALKKGAFDYLLKPIDPEELSQTLKRISECEEDENQKISKNQLEKVLNVSSTFSLNSKIALIANEGTFLKSISDIVRVESAGNYSKFYFHDQKKALLIAKTLKEYDTYLKNSGFVRIHISHLINVHHLVSYHPKNGGHVIMSNGDIIPVSVRKKSNLLSELKKRSV